MCQEAGTVSLTVGSLWVTQRLCPQPQLSVAFQMASGCSCRMRKTTACAGSAWTPSSTASCSSAGTWSPAPSAASAWASVPSAGSTWCAPCTSSSPEAEDPPGSIPDVSVHRRDWKLPVQNLKLFLKIIFTTNWGQERFILSCSNTGPCCMPVSWRTGSVSQFLLGFFTHLWLLIAEVRLLMASATVLFGGHLSCSLISPSSYF